MGKSAQPRRTATSRSYERSRKIGAMFRRLMPSGKGQWMTPIIMLLLLLGIVAGALIISSVTQQHVRLDDGTVWITSLKDRKAARFNVKVKDTDAGVSSSAARFDVAQHDGDTVLLEGTKASHITASTVSEDGDTAIKADMQTLVGGNTIAFINVKTGNVWAGASSDVKSVNPTTASPKMKLGAGGRIAVTHDGAVYGYRQSDGAILKMDGPQATPAKVAEIGAGQRLQADSFTVVADTPVLASGNAIHWPDGNAEVSMRGTLTLQAPPTDGRQSGWVAAAGQRGLVTVDLKATNPTPVETSNSGKGNAAQPVSTNGCVSAAWSQKANNYLRVCSAHDGKPQFKSLQNVNATSELVFRANHRLTVLNDVVNGNVWNPQESTKVIKIQWNKVQTQQTKQQEQNTDSANNQHNFSKTCSSQSGQIKAEDDMFGVRAGSSQILDVLRNDEQTDCSVLRITSASAPDGGDVTVSPIYDGRYLQLNATSASAGTVTFSYEISDGRGQTSSAIVTLNITDGADLAPVQTDTPPETDVEQGATYTTNALGSFADPDGDPLTLVSAVPTNTDQVTVSTRADGQLVFNAGSMTSGRASIEVSVSDGEQTGTGTLYFSVKPANTLGAVIDPVVRQTTPDTRTTVSLKQYVHGTSAEPAQLTAVETPNGASTTMNATDMSFTFTAANPGTYYVPYTITQGSIPTTGLARVEVQAVTGDSAKPVAANDVALLGADNTAIVEPLSNDVDPMGGVLSVTSVKADAASGIKTGVVSNKRVYITARQMPTRPVQLTYSVANAAGSSTGTIVLQPPALTTANSVPKADNIDAQVRTDGIVSVDVLDHVTYSDGTTVSLQNNLQYDRGTFKGLVFVSGDTVRYQASDQTGTFPVTYTVKDNLGNAASGTITFTVHQKDASNKTAPTPSDAEAQVAAGQKVRIPITLTGIDSDGDDDQLLGLGNKAPQLGRITEVGATYLVYEAYADSSGTDTFSYAVEDWTGQRAQAQIRVGVFRSGTDSGVYARDDEITLRPNTAATVPVSQNDISGDNTDLTVDRNVESQGIDGVKVKDNTLSFTTPKQSGTYYVIYTVKDKAGLSDTATLTVNVDEHATIEPPTAYDYRVPSSATIDRKSVDVDVSRWIANPSGTADELRVGVDASAADHARVKGDRKSTVITVDLTDEARAVPYTVTNTTENITSTAFIQVPAYGVFPPTLRPKAPALKVNARETITINIADYVRVGAGKTAYVDGAGSVSATKAGNDDLYVNDQTLKFTAPKDYAGPASITFTAVDGKHGKNDKVKIVNSAVLTLPITVVGRDVPAPTFSSTTVDVVAGEDPTTIDLTALTHSPSGAYDDEREYTYSGGVSSDQVATNVSPDGKLAVSADRAAAPGTTVSVPITISYAKGSVQAGVTVRVVASTRPIARIGAKSLKVKAGSSEQVNVLADAYNPFPDTALTVTGCQSDGSARLMVDCPANGVISITAASDIGASTNHVIVTVRDATRTKEREVTGTISVSVTDRPEAPLLSPIAGDPQDGAVNLSWTAGSSNGSPITEYRVSWTGDASGEKSCGTVTACQVTGLTNGRKYTFTVTAQNEVGWSNPSNAVDGQPDKIPSAPEDVRAEANGNIVAVTWSAPQGNFSEVTEYEVTLTGDGISKRESTSATAVNFNFENNAIKDGMSISATVRARNRVNWSQPSQASNAITPRGVPDKPTVTAVQQGERIVVSSKLGDMRNAGCEAVTVSFAGIDTGVACGSSDVSATFDIVDSWYYQSFTPTITLTTKYAGTVTAQGDAITPDIKPDKPTGVRVAPEGDHCVASWNAAGRHHDGFIVNVPKQGNTPTTSLGTTYPLERWGSCGTVTVWQTFKGHTSDPEQASNGEIGNKVQASITLPSLYWDNGDANVIHVSGGAVNAYNQAVTVTIVLSDESKKPYSFEWHPGLTTTLDASTLPQGSSYSWLVKVEGTTDKAIDNTQQSHTELKDGDRYKAPSPSPSTPDSSDGSQGGAGTPSASTASLFSAERGYPWVREIRLLRQSPNSQPAEQPIIRQ
ncbi:Ig-like domain-containing protein [Bifidobacterium moukalabense]|uniref:Ig-like domain-containing protein n=1 Tax=Bifidobacterium moukalabense TaxID=1333651 RepID=UPI0010F5581C|nr:Ig-like domain-containing protein [Bifidobacterium moukalabense]